MESGGVNG